MEDPASIDELINAMEKPVSTVFRMMLSELNKIKEEQIRLRELVNSSEDAAMARPQETVDARLR